MTDPPADPFLRAIIEAEATAGGTTERGPRHSLYRYPDHATYRAVQIAGNKAKLWAQWVPESHIARLARHVDSTIGPVAFGLCHGTRRGAEQAWFRHHLPGTPEVIGTEISDTAAHFPHTVQWDFHDPNPAWSGRADFVYSNSWDHACDPDRAFAAWIDALRPGGLLLLDHTIGHTPEAANALDPFGTTHDGLLAWLSRFASEGRLIPGLDTRGTAADYPARVVIFEKAS